MMDTSKPPKDPPDTTPGTTRGTTPGTTNETVGIPDGMAEHDPKGLPNSDRQQTETGPHQS